MKLAEFLRLSDKETKQLFTIKNLIQIKDSKSLYNILVKYDPKLLLKLSLVDDGINEICGSKDFTYFWNNCLSLESFDSQQGDEMSYQVMETVSSFELLKGLYLYHAYRDLVDNLSITQELKQDSEEFLKASARHGCYFAMKALCIDGLNQLKNKFDSEVAVFIIEYANLAAQLYLSAGYLLLGNVYQELLQYKEQDCLSSLISNQKSFEAILMAEKLEDYSGSMINNAYQGKSIEEASNGQIKSFKDAVMHAQQSLNLSAKELQIAYDKMNHLSMAIKSKLSDNQASQTKASISVRSI